MQIPYLTAADKVQLPNVDEVLTLDYALHAASDDAIQGSHLAHVARAVVDKFLGIKLAPSSAAEAYHMASHGIIVSHARGIRRRKEQWQRDLDSAHEKREGALAKIADERLSFGNLNSVWQLLAPVILGLSGYLIAKIFSLAVPTDIAQQTGPRMPAVVLGLVFVFIGRYVSYWLHELRRNEIEVRYRADCYSADVRYELGKKQEYTLYRTQLCEGWSQYTGEDYPDTASYEMVMAGDLETRRTLERRARVGDKSTLWLIRRTIKLIRRKRNGKY